MKIELNNNIGFTIVITTNENASTEHVKNAIKLAMKIEGYSEVGIEDIFKTNLSKDEVQTV